MSKAAALDALHSAPVDSLVFVLSRHDKALKNTKLLEPTLKTLVDQFALWTHDFSVEDGRVANLTKAEVLIDSLIRHRTFAGLGDSMVQFLAQEPFTPTRAAWLLAYARSQRRRYDSAASLPTAAADELVPTRAVPEICWMVHDDALLARAWSAVRNTPLVRKSPDPKFWSSLKKSLSLP